MKVNFYLPLPGGWSIKDVKNKPILSNGLDFNITNYFLTYAMVNLYRSLQKKYPNIEIIPIDNEDKAQIYCCCTKYNIFIPLLENPDNGKHIAISYCDTQKTINKNNGWEDLDNCLELFAIGGIHLDDISYKNFTPLIKYTPCTNSTWLWDGYQTIKTQQQILNKKIIPKKPIFLGGGIHNFRKWVKENDNRFDMREGLMPNLFIKEMNKYSIHIDFNGGAEVSNRTFEAFGLGAALIRPALNLQYHNKLIPGHHYAEVPFTSLPNYNEITKPYCDESTIKIFYKELADSYIETFEKVKNDKDYRIFLGENGRKWWDENCTLESYTKIFTKLIDLNKLK